LGEFAPSVQLRFIAIQSSESLSATGRFTPQKRPGLLRLPESKVRSKRAGQRRKADTHTEYNKRFAAVHSVSRESAFISLALYLQLNSSP
jgi:hypothetical protein